MGSLADYIIIVLLIGVVAGIFKVLERLKALEEKLSRTDGG